MNTSISDRSKIYLNPYLGGVLLGMVLLATFYITGRGLGASGAMKSTVVTAVNTVAPVTQEIRPITVSSSVMITTP